MRTSPYLPLLFLLFASCSSSEASAPGAPLGDASVDGLLPSDASPGDTDGGGDAMPPRPDSAPPPDAGRDGDAGIVREECPADRESVWVVDPSLCLRSYSDSLPGARGLAFAPGTSDLFAVVTGQGAVVVLFDEDGDGKSSASERSTFARVSGNHGLAFSPAGDYVYVSSDTTVWRFPYKSGDRTASAAAETVITGMPAGGHSTRTLVFGTDGALYINIGSAGNLDRAESLASRALLKKFTIPSPLTRPLTMNDGVTFATGLRNEVGLLVDSKGRMWGVENGRDNLSDAEFGRITNDNPAEELNRFDGAGPSFYGYPYCWTEGQLANGGGPGTQWADEEVESAHRKTDAWCKDPANVRVPAYAMQGHWAPLGLTEVTTTTRLPDAWLGDLIVASHGSWNRSPATGRLLARARLDGAGNVLGVDPVVGQKGADGGLAQGSWGARPVDVRQGPDGALYFSDDSGGRVFRLHLSR